MFFQTVMLGKGQQLVFGHGQNFFGLKTKEHFFGWLQWPEQRSFYIPTANE